MSLVGEIAKLVAARVLVVGSLPPDGRDLDLLVRPAEAEAIEAGLPALGFERREGVWARFRDCEADVVDLTPADAWGLAPPALESLFSLASPIEAAGKVCRPAPEHALVIAARRAVRDGPRLSAKRQERVALEAGEGDTVFERARTAAGEWGIPRSLAALERAHRDGATLSATVRRRAIAEDLGRSRGASRAWVDGWRAVLKRPRRGAMLAVAGGDGANEWHVRKLAATLGLLGYDAVPARGATWRTAWLALGRGKVVVVGADELGPAARGRAITLSVEGDDERACAALARAAWSALS